MNLWQAWRARRQVVDSVWIVTESLDGQRGDCVVAVCKDQGVARRVMKRRHPGEYIVCEGGHMHSAWGASGRGWIEARPYVVKGFVASLVPDGVEVEGEVKVYASRGAWARALQIALKWDENSQDIEA